MRAVPVHHSAIAAFTKRHVLVAGLAAVLPGLHAASVVWACVPCDGRASVRPDDVLTRYGPLVRLYRQGSTNEAVSDLAAFDLAALRAISKHWLAPASGGSGGETASPGELSLAGMLHTDCAFALYAARELERADAHLNLARALVDAAYPGAPLPRSFRRRWYLTALMFLHREGIGGMAILLRDAALAVFPHDEPLLLEAGAIEEALAMSAPIDLLDEDGLREARLQSDQHLKRATGFLRRALDVDETLPEPLIRLARVTALLGEEGRAVDMLVRVLEADPPPELGYLANLLLARMEDRVGRLDAAADHYRAAIAAFPVSQAARSGLAQVLYQRGDTQAALDAVRQGLAIRFQNGQEDPWWRYPRSQFRSFDELLVALRQEARR
jgi:tetratricopeptide (TPR) repeat protein